MLSSEVWLNILKVSPIPIAVFGNADKRYSLLFSNTAYLELLGIRDSEIVNKLVSEVFLSPGIQVNDGFITDLIQSIEKVFENGLPDLINNVEFIVQYQHRAVPETFFIDVENTPILEEGRVKYVSQSIFQHRITDIPFQSKTQSPEPHSRAELIETILQNLPIGIAVNRIDSGDATLVNSQFAETYGWAENDLIDIKTFFNKVYPDSLYRSKILDRVMDDINSGDESRMLWENIEITTSTGEKRIINAKNIPLADQNLMISTVVDVTQQARQAAEIRRVKVNQETLINSSEDLIWSVDTDCKIITANSAFLNNLKHITGRDLKEGDPVQDNVFGDEVNKKWKTYYDRTLKGESFTVKEESFNPQKNRTDYSVVSFNPMRNEQGEIFGAACYSKDITNDTLALIALQKARNENQKIMESSLDVICTIDGNGCFVSVSSAAKKIWGYTPEELVGRPYMELVYQEDKIITIDASRNIMGGTEMTNFENRYVKKDGSLISIIWSARWDDNDQIMYCIAKDATERNRAEYNLKRSEKRYRSLVENGADAVVILDIEGKPLYVSPSITRVLGYSEDEALSLQLIDLIHPADREAVAERLFEAMKSPGETISGHTSRVKHKDGSWRWLEATLTNMMHDPMINGIVDNFRDVTVRVEAELEKSLLINNTEESFILLNKDLEIVSFNNQFEKLYKKYFNLVIEKGQSILVYAQAERRTIVSEIYNRVLKGESEISEINVADSATRERKIFSLKYKPAKNFEGEIIGVFVTAIDITERQLVLEKLKENESKLLASQKIAKVGYWQSFPDTKGLYWSDEVYNIWGLDKQTFKLDYDAHFNTIHPDDREEFLRSREKAFKEGVQHDIEHRIILPDGSIKWVHALGNLIKNDRGEIIIFEGTVQDITVDKLALEKLLVSEARHRGIFESQTNYMIRTDLEGNYSFCNNKFLQDFGWLYEGKEIIGENCMNSILEYHHERVAETVAKCFAELNKVFQVFIDKPRKDGNGVVTTLWDFICLTDSKGQPSEIQCVGIDVSEWKRAQEELEASNARYEYVTRATSDAIWDWDMRTDEVYLGGGFQSLFGYSVERSESRRTFWKNYVHPEDLKLVIEYIENIINEKQEAWTLEFRFKKSDGKYAFVLNKSILIRDSNGTPIKIVGAIQDISDNKIAESQKILHAETSKLFNQPDANLNDILDRVLQHILNYGEIAIAEIWLPSSDKRHINLSSKCSKDGKFDQFYDDSSDFKSFLPGQGLPGKIWVSGKMELWQDIENDPKFLRFNAAKSAALKTAIGLPLIYNEEFIGVLLLSFQEKEENLQQHIAFRDVFCRHLSSEIKRKQLDQELKQIFSFAPDVISVAGTDGYFKKINPAACEMLGYTENELLSLPVTDFVHPDDKNITGQVVKSLNKRTATFYFENRYITKSGKVIWLGWTSTPSPDEGLIFAVAKDITEKKNLEVLLEKSNTLAEIGSWEIDIRNNSLYWSSITKQIHEVEADYEPDTQTADHFYPEGNSRESVRNAIEQCILHGTVFDMELQIITGKGNNRWVRVIGESEYINGQCVKVYGSFQNITHRKLAELELLKIYEEKNTILESIQDGFFAVDKIWMVTYWNREAEKLLGKTKNQTLGRNLWNIFDNMSNSISYSKYHEAIDTNQVIHFEDYFPEMQRWYEISAYPSIDGLSVFFKDITERKNYDSQLRNLNLVLKNKVKELAISNRELEEFAYVASHDLQEPLRMISSFLTQLQRKYNDRLDAKAHQYINFAVDGAKRMRQIILDLLDFSRVGRSEAELELVNINEIINEILILFRKNIEETNTSFIVGDLPSINIPRASIRQLIQNLISNALKYHSTEKDPLIEISFSETPELWLFWVKDNGIGISSDYFEKIFIIFQRLHTKDQYSGTGMGLAICRKIVENLGGKLWIESEEGKGSTFYFTIPKLIQTEGIKDGE